MHKRLETTKTLQTGARDTPKPKPSNPTPLSEPASNSKPRLIYLDTCYLISLAQSDYPILESLARLRKTENDEIIITKQVLDELTRISVEKRTEDGRLVLEGRHLAEIKDVAYSPLCKIEEVQITESDRAEAKDTMAANSEKKNSRVGEGELSIWLIAKAMVGLFEQVVMSFDSDVKALMKGIGEQIPNA